MVGGDIRFVADPTSGSLLIVGPPELVSQVTQMVALLDVMPLQVLVEVVVAEVSLDAVDQLGFQWTWPAGLNAAPNGGITLGGMGQGLKYTFLAGTLQGVFQTLQQSGKVRVLSTPKILTANNQPARVEATTKVPYVTSVREDQNKNATRAAAPSPCV